MVRIYTKTGDDGTTGLLYGGRVAKDSSVMQVNGAVDEAQAMLGLARAEAVPGSELDTLLVRLERELYVLMAEVATDMSKRAKLDAGDHPCHRGDGGRARDPNRRSDRPVRDAGRVRRSRGQPRRPPSTYPVPLSAEPSVWSVSDPVEGSWSGATSIGCRTSSGRWPGGLRAMSTSWPGATVPDAGVAPRPRQLVP